MLVLIDLKVKQSNNNNADTANCYDDSNDDSDNGDNIYDNDNGDNDNSVNNNGDNVVTQSGLMNRISTGIDIVQLSYTFGYGLITYAEVYFSKASSHNQKQ